jgi:transposase-like protein
VVAAVLRGEISVTEGAQRAGVSRSRVSRWVKADDPARQPGDEAFVELVRRTALKSETVRQAMARMDWSRAALRARVARDERDYGPSPRASSGAGGSPGPRKSKKQAARERLMAAVAEARRLGIKVTVVAPKSKEG